jgi:acetyl-CoA acetyltransferase
MSLNPFAGRKMAIPDFSAAMRLAARNVYEQAGFGPEAIDLIELHDCFATAEIVHYENLEICDDGKAGRFIADDETQLGGGLVNVLGGFLSKGYPPGAIGIASIYEVATHLCAEAGERQVEGAVSGLIHAR